LVVLLLVFSSLLRLVTFRKENRELLPLSAHYVYYVKLSVTIRQILSTLLSYRFQILNLS
ncbi:hypothetical protein, partial [Vibrio parahaemolyticus]|uniref:hypothetical protein n=1 Tax=Vibrio parahaemolyticus TaxID=670 RepID=UPI0030EEBA3F